MPLDALTERINLLSERLLDLTARNRLLNTKFKSAGRNLFRVIDELPDELLKKLIRGKMTFKSLPAVKSDPTDENTRRFKEALEIARQTEEDYLTEMELIEEEGLDDVGDAELKALRDLKDRVRATLGMNPRPRATNVRSLREHAIQHGISPDYDLPRLGPNDVVEAKWKDKKIQTLLLPDALNASLKTITTANNSSQKESGINTLYIAFGFLKWEENPHSTKSMYAPLLLLPIEMHVDKKIGGKHKHSVSSTGDNLSVNQALNERLKRDFNKRLPEFMVDEDGESQTIDDYFDKVEETLAEPSGWTVKRWAAFGIFNYRNMAIYQDLKKLNSDNTSQLAKLFLDAGGDSDSSFDDDLEEYEIDADETMLLLPSVIEPADASQHSAILDVINGRSIVIKGPPGTGKSQTITNIIAGYLYQGKSVLFVAQKQAALDVVRNRLNAAGLKELLLEVFSIKNTKKAITQSLGERLDMEIPTQNAYLDEQIRQLQTTKQGLNIHASVMSQEYGESGRSIQEIFWDHPDNFSQLPETLENYSIPNPKNISLIQLDRDMEILQVFSRDCMRIDNQAGDDIKIWSGVTKIIGNPNVLDELQVTLQNSVEKAKTLESMYTTLIENKELADDPVVSNIEKFSEFLSNKKTKEVLTTLIPFIETIDKLVVSAILNPSTSRQLKHVFMLDEDIKNYRKSLGESRREIEPNFDLKNIAYKKEEIKEAADTLSKGNNWATAFLTSGWSGGKDLMRANSIYNSCSLGEKTNNNHQKGSELLELIDFLTLKEKLNKNISTAESKLKALLVTLDEAIPGVSSQIEGLLEDVATEILGVTTLLPYLTENIRLAIAAKPAIASKLSDMSNRTNELKEMIETLILELGIDRRQDLGFALTSEDILSSREHLETLLNGWHALNSHMEKLGSEQNIREQGLSDFYERYLTTELPIEEIDDWYKSTVRRVQHKDIWNDHEDILATSTGESLERQRERMKTLDKEVRDKFRAVVKLNGYQRGKSAPAGNRRGRVSEHTEMSLIQRMVKKPKNHTSIRQFFDRANTAITYIKPCVMMSPTTVAQTLPLDEVFDVVIIDEASQMKPEYALGAIARAKQAVIVGDQKQLPPSTHGERRVQDMDDEDLEVDESILDSALVVLPARELLFHYRSRHEDLIKFSNQEFYGNLNFPTTANRDRRNRGIAYRYIENANYQPARDGRGGGINLNEANAMADQIVNFMTNRKEESLGVAVINNKQRGVLQTIFDQRSSSNPSVREYLTKWAKEDEGLNEFFIKNLENVQGDERDVIMVGTVYGPTAEGDRVAQRFGDIVKTHGERRLNVLFTRARNQLFLFTSLKPTDILITPNSKEGVKTLRKYLIFAETKELQEATLTSRPVPSKFQQWGIDVVNSVPGFSCDSEIGAQNFFIDIGVKHEDYPYGYILAVETDGGRWHTGISARDNDLLRQEILENHGWVFHRIWGPDYDRDRRGARDKLVEAMQNRLTEVMEEMDARTRAMEQVQSRNTEQPEEEEETSVDTQPQSEPYMTANIHDLIDVDPGLFYDTSYDESLKDAIELIIDTEGPIEQATLIERVRVAHGWNKAGNKMRNRITDLLPSGVYKQDFRDSVFYWLNSSLPEQWHTGRYPVLDIGETKRKVPQVAPQEIRAIAELEKMADEYLHQKSAIARKVSKFLGWATCRSAARDYIIAALDEDEA